MRTILPGTPRDSSRVGGLPPLTTPDLWATHPTVAAQPHDGHHIMSVFPYGPDLLLGYGDWTNNTGPLDLVGVNLATAQPVTLVTGVRTEAIEAFRVIDGALYVPWIDTDSTADALGGGYVTDAGGTWHEVVIPGLVHTFDVASTGTTLVAVGSGNGGGVCISSDDGATWTLDPPTSSTSRWHTVIAGPAGIYLPGGSFLAPRRRDPSGTWHPWSLARSGSRVEHARPTHGNLTFGAGVAIDTTAGTVTEFSRTYLPQCVVGDVLYGARWLDGALVVAVTDPSDVRWDPVLRLPWGGLIPPWLGASPGASSQGPGIAVVDDFVYVGGSQGRIFRAPIGAH